VANNTGGNPWAEILAHLLPSPIVLSKTCPTAHSLWHHHLALPFSINPSFPVSSLLRLAVLRLNTLEHAPSFEHDCLLPDALDKFLFKKLTTSFSNVFPAEQQRTS
jgi:hypothetical protein